MITIREVTGKGLLHSCLQLIFPFIPLPQTTVCIGGLTFISGKKEKFSHSQGSTLFKDFTTGLWTGETDKQTNGQQVGCMVGFPQKSEFDRPVLLPAHRALPFRPVDHCKIDLVPILGPEDTL